VARRQELEALHRRAQVQLQGPGRSVLGVKLPVGSAIASVESMVDRTLQALLREKYQANRGLMRVHRDFTLERFMGPNRSKPEGEENKSDC
jgi:hypothetical protein